MNSYPDNLGLISADTYESSLLASGRSGRIASHWLAALWLAAVLVKKSHLYE